jgi:hypothetical protein
MIQETWDTKVTNYALADELAQTPGGPVMAAIRAGFLQWKEQLAGSDNNYWFGQAKKQIEYSISIGLFDLRVKEDAYRRGVIRQDPKLTNGDGDKRAQSNNAISESDAATFVKAASKLDATLVEQWLAVREVVKKRLLDSFATTPDLVGALAEWGDSEPDIQRSRRALNQRLVTAGWKGK